MSDRVRHRRLEWLGHVARLDPERLPNQLLFSNLLTSRPACGPRRRWREVIREDLRDVPDWFAVATDRTAWRNFINTPAEPGQPSPAIVCDICYRSFRRSCDMARHKCKAERQLPLQLQRGALQCPVCSKWFASKGGHAVHKCSLVDADPILRSRQQLQSRLVIVLCASSANGTLHLPVSSATTVTADNVQLGSSEMASRTSVGLALKSFGVHRTLLEMLSVAIDSLT